MSTSKFWIEDPNELFHSCLFPNKNLDLEENANALTRLILLVSFISFLFASPIRVLVISLLCIGIIVVYYYYTSRRKGATEGFVENLALEREQYKEDILDSDKYDTPSANNPFSNVMLTDYVDNPNKLPAPPAFNPVVQSEIVKKAKQAVQKCNSTDSDFTDKLFSDIGEQLSFEQSLRNYGSNPVTTIPGDQEAFKEFCYGDMVSCKEGSILACDRNLPRFNGI